MLPPATAGLRAAAGALTGTTVAAGWLLVELALFLRGGEAALVLRRLGPSWLALLGGGAAVGVWLVRRPRTLAALSIALAAAALWARGQADFRFGHPGFLLAPLAALAGALAAASWTSGSRTRGAHRALSPFTAMSLGALACVLAGRLQFGAWPLPFEVLAPLALAAATELAALAGLVGRGPRALATLAAVLLGAGLVGRSVAAGAELGPAGIERPPSPPASGAPNVVLAVLDTVRADRLSCYGHARETTPGLDAFAREEATRYTNARSTAPYTLGSHASLLTGLFPAQHGASVGGPGSRPIREGIPLLGERFAAAGYTTGAVVANRFYLNRRLGFDRGFHHFDARVGTRVAPFQALGQALAAPRLGHLYRDAERITELALEWVDGLEPGPFFLFLNYLDAHAPFRPPRYAWKALGEPGRALDDYAFEERRLLMYDSEVLYLDRWLTRLRAGLRERGVYDETLFVVTADHGHGFGDHGHEEHSWLLYDEQLRVPLLVKPPRSAGGLRPAVDERLMTGADVHDLLLREAGLEVPGRPPTLDGLTGEWYPWTLTPRDRYIGRRMGRDLSRHLITWVRGDRKLIVYSDGEVEAFDLARDPGELEPLELSTAELEAARAEAAAWWDAYPPPQDEATPLDEELVRELSELGYG